MSEFVEKSAGKDEKDNVCDDKDFVPRFVKVFNETKTYDRPSEIGEQNKDTSRKKMDNEHDVKITTSPFLSYEQYRRRSFKDEGGFSIDMSGLCKIPPLQMSLHVHDRRKKIVRTNTDSKIIIPKIEEPDDDPFQDIPLEEISSHNAEGSIENLKERLKEGKCFICKIGFKSRN